MPDNITAPAGGVSFATDEIAGVHFPYAKLAFGAANSAVAVADADGARLPVLIGGTLPGFAATPTFNIGSAPTLAVTAAALPLPAGAASLAAQTSGNSSLASIDGKLAALSAGRMPVEVNTQAATTREYATATALRLAVALTSSTAALPTLGASREIYLHAVGTRLYARTGDSTVTAALAAAHHVIEAGEKFHWRVPAGHTHVAVIGDGGTGSAIVNAVA